MHYVLVALSYLITNAVSLTAGAVVGYLFGARVVAMVKYLVGKI